MYILGLNIGHNATAALLKDGKILQCVSEERFSRIKNHHGIPFASLQYVLAQEKITPGTLDLVVLDDQYPVVRNPHFGKNFFNAYTEKSLKRKLFSSLGYRYPGAFQAYYATKERLLAGKKQREREALKSNLSRILQVHEEKILIADHHLMHAFATLSNLDQKKRWLIFTLDGEGSGLCATVNIYDGKTLKVIAQTPKTASLGYFYGLATLHLGMKPLEHEFKVMGLAPYAKTHAVNPVYQQMRKLFTIDDNLVFHTAFSMPFADHYFRKEMRFVRFDILAAAVQKLTEELCCLWIEKTIRKTNIHHVALAGGVFMNVKANKRIAELPGVKEIFVMPSAGDESNALGACWYGYKMLCEKNNMLFTPAPLEHLYLGPAYDEAYLERFIKQHHLAEQYTITKIKNINRVVAELLAKGEIIARCSGRSEWGARALGNRSILANPSHPNTIRILNETIKDRDFWMPFTPSILDSFEKKYLINPKEIVAPYMALTFDSTPLAQDHLPAAIHPYDFTIRPQIVTQEHNPDYYDLLLRFQKKTGKGAILNTSFNLHGEPNVLSPEDALHTLENSSLNYLVLNNTLLEKKKKTQSL